MHIFGYFWIFFCIFCGALKKPAYISGCLGCKQAIWPLSRRPQRQNQTTDKHWKTSFIVSDSPKLIFHPSPSLDPWISYRKLASFNTHTNTSVLLTKHVRIKSFNQKQHTTIIQPTPETNESKQPTTKTNRLHRPTDSTDPSLLLSLEASLCQGARLVHAQALNHAEALERLGILPGFAHLAKWRTGKRRFRWWFGFV